MLCPSCGVEVGPVSKFCERCQQARISGSSSGGIGRISPKQVYRKVSPEERAKILRERAEYYSSKSGQQKQLSKRQQALLMWIVGSSSVLFIFVVLLVLFNPDRRFWRALGFGTPGTVELFPTVQPVPLPQPDENSGLQTGDEQDEQIGFERFGSLSVAGLRYSIAELELNWRPETSAMTISCFSGDSRPDAALPLPIMRVLLQFEKGAKENSLQNLRGYEVKILYHGRLYAFAREYSGRTSAFGEVSHLAGRLAIGEPVIGSMRSDALEEIDGKAVKFTWDLRFTGTLEKER